MTEKVNLNEPVKTICEALGLQYENVARLDIEPSMLAATVYRTNKRGSKYIENGEAAQDILEFKIQT